MYDNQINCMSFLIASNLVFLSFLKSNSLIHFFFVIKNKDKLYINKYIK